MSQIKIEEYMMSIKISHRNIHANSIRYAPTAMRYFVNLKIKEIRKSYVGVIAEEPILKGQIIGINGGQVLTSVEDIPEDYRYSVLIDKNLFLAPTDFSKMEIGWFINHSCDSNVERIGSLIARAKKDILIGDELTIDYAPLIAGIDNWKMPCHCCSNNCRHIITGQDWLNKDCAKNLWNEWLPHIQKEIINRNLIE
jgi:hypothetical protein